MWAKVWAQVRCVDNRRVGVNHYENFPVASLLCPPGIRPAVVAIYHFARTADDIADEGDATPLQRLSDLKQYRADLAAIFEDRVAGPTWATVFDGLNKARRDFALPHKLLNDLLDAFTQDVHNPAYADRPQLLGYCQLSANPIGRLLLHLHGVVDEQALRQSDAICSALQLINFWQDISVDLPRQRVYLPQSELLAHGISHTDLQTLHDSTATRALVKDLCDWAERLMQQGAPLVLRLPGRSGWELRLVVQGGLRILEKIRAMNYAVMRQRPRLWFVDLFITAYRALLMSPGNKKGLT